MRRWWHQHVLRHGIDSQWMDPSDRIQYICGCKLFGWTTDGDER